MVRIQHHPARAALLPELTAALDPLPVEIITDPEPDEKPSPWRTYLHCLHDLPATSHLLIVQDDATVCRNFPAALELIAAANPERPVVLFVGQLARSKALTGRLMQQAVRQGRPYAAVHRQDFCPVVAMLWPTHKAAAFRDWALEHPHIVRTQPTRSDDKMTGEWMRRRNEPFVATVPSLVEHPDVEPSLIRRSGGCRTAIHYIGDGDPLAIDWSQV